MIKKLPKLILTDIDGVWTDGGMYYLESNNEFNGEIKKFNTSDSAGIIFLKVLNIKTGIVTGETTKIVEHRSKKLKIDFLFQGVKNKHKVVEDLIKKLNINFSDVAYIGDDINDLKLLRAVGFSACPNNSPEYIKSKVDKIMSKSGGDGVFREFVEFILIETNNLELALSKTLEII